MKESFTQEVRQIFDQSRTWVELQIEFAKLTAAEKVTIMTSACVVGAICGLLAVVVIILLSLALVDVFRLIMAPALAYLSVCGVLLVLIILIYAFRRILVYNPIARYMTRLLLSSASAGHVKKEEESKN